MTLLADVAAELLLRSRVSFPGVRGHHSSLENAPGRSEGTNESYALFSGGVRDARRRRVHSTSEHRSRTQRDALRLDAPALRQLSTTPRRLLLDSAEGRVSLA